MLKRQLDYTKVRYRGLDKNANYVFASCALSNLVTAKKRLLRLSMGVVRLEEFTEWTES